MNGNIKFSIITPVYKVEKYLDECVSSVLAQSYENFELILVDDGSPDRSGLMCDAWAAKDKRVKVIHKENGGAVSARCMGIEKAEGDYYMFLDSDDTLRPCALEVLFAKISETGADCLIYGSEKKAGDRVIELGVCGENVAGRLICDKREALGVILTDAAYNALWRKCARAACFDGRDYTPYYAVRHGEDRLCSLEILENAKSFLFLSEILHSYRHNTESVTQTICYDDREVDNTVELLVDEMLQRTGVFAQEDYDRLQNMRLNGIAVEAHARMKFCSSTEKAIEGLKMLRENEFDAKIIESGYKNVEGYHGNGGLHGYIYRMNISLLRRRRYKTMLFIDRSMRRLSGR